MASGKKMARGEAFKTPECRLSFAQDLFVAKKKESDDGTTREGYGATLIFKNEHRPFLEKKVAEVILAEWPKDGLDRAKKGLIKSPFLAGDGKEARNKSTGELHPGMGPDVFFIRVVANKPPVVRSKSETIPATQEEVYSGCYGFGAINAFAWNNVKNGDGITFGIEYFQKTRDGERIGGSGPVDPGKWFEKIDDQGDAPQETKQGAGAGGLFG